MSLAEPHPLLHVGLSSWIIQDGNCGDFAVGQEAKFALGFFPSSELRPAQERLPEARHLSASVYRCRAPSLGALLEGEIDLGIDPFFYFEALHQVRGMPPLSYRWVIRDIQLETTPWVRETSKDGRTVLHRADGARSFAPLTATDAGRDDEGRAEYVLSCARVGGPEAP